jgi:hypothetical protein
MEALEGSVWMRAVWAVHRVYVILCDTSPMTTRVEGIFWKRAFIGSSIQTSNTVAQEATHREEVLRER